jgi:hypothetical protein
MKDSHSTQVHKRVIPIGIHTRNCAGACAFVQALVRILVQALVQTDSSYPDRCPHTSLTGSSISGSRLH